MYSCINDVSTQSWYIRGRSMDSRARVDHFRNPLETAKHHLFSCRKWRKVIRNNKLPGGRNVPSEILLKSPFDFAVLLCCCCWWLQANLTSAGLPCCCWWLLGLLFLLLCCSCCCVAAAAAAGGGANLTSAVLLCYVTSETYRK